ncbi:MAG TPA: sugar transferase [Cyclobacteriaceae bacterium]|nr:sugar transferase [Cyclobacteriaceae bacterium]HNU41165.1 sugar transferase [Cyclobacteriaceae bacterium]
MIKRSVDFVFALLGLIILFPFFLVIGIWIKLDSTGPVFYLQERVGKNRKLFKLFKFRTMHTNADKLTAITVGARDPRITSLGYYLRKYKVDELPQLINVFNGTMSLVGPRPELEKFVKLYNAEQLNVITVKPGITDYASIEFRNENEMLEGKDDPIDFYIREIMPVKLKLNLRYIEDHSLWVDLKIILKTIFLIIFKK